MRITVNMRKWIRPILIIPSHLRLDILRGLFPVGLHVKIVKWIIGGPL